MCFSASASFIAGGSLTAIGSATLTQTTNKKQIPFASIPLLFSIQQIIEGVVWLSFDVAWLNATATYIYAMFAIILWPIFTPFSVLLLEKTEWRRKILITFLVLGIGLNSYVGYCMLKDSVSSSIVNHSLAYNIHSFDEFHPVHFLGIALYLLTVIGSCFISSYKKVNLFGGALLVSSLSAYIIFNTTFYSTWCFFAAVLSVIIFWHFHSEKKAIAAQATT